MAFTTPLRLAQAFLPKWRLPTESRGDFIGAEGDGRERGEFVYFRLDGLGRDAVRLRAFLDERGDDAFHRRLRAGAW